MPIGAIQKPPGEPILLLVANNSLDHYLLIFILKHLGGPLSTKSFFKPTVLGDCTIVRVVHLIGLARLVFALF